MRRFPDASLSGRRVARELTALIERRGKPDMIVSDNGTEFTSNAMLGWAQDHGIVWHFVGKRSPRTVRIFGSSTAVAHRDRGLAIQRRYVRA